jgi:Domain of unknown function (DUF4266)
MTLFRCFIGVFLIGSLLSGCASTEVRAWEKSALAKPSMAFDGNVLEAKFADHTFQSKEGSRGNGTVGGGGCGCN